MIKYISWSLFSSNFSIFLVYRISEESFFFYSFTETSNNDWKLQLKNITTYFLFPLLSKLKNRFCYVLRTVKYCIWLKTCHESFKIKTVEIQTRKLTSNYDKVIFKMIITQDVITRYLWILKKKTNQLMSKVPIQY